VALLLLLLVLLFGLGTGSSSSSSGPAPAMHVLFTIDGRQVDAKGEPTLRPGQVLGFPRTVVAFTLKRLECNPVVVHPIRLAASHTWRVPDLAEGAYSISGSGPTFTFDYLVRVHNHAAPCLG